MPCHDKCESVYSRGAKPFFSGLGRSRRVFFPQKKRSWNVGNMSFPEKTRFEKTGPISFYLPDPSWAKWPYGPWDHFMFSSKKCLGPCILPSDIDYLSAHPIFKFTTYWINSPCVTWRFSFCRIQAFSDLGRSRRGFFFPRKTRSWIFETCTFLEKCVFVCVLMHFGVL